MPNILYSTGIRVTGPELDWTLWSSGSLFYWIEPEYPIRPQCTGEGMTRPEAFRFARDCGATDLQNPNRRAGWIALREHQ